MQRLEKQKLPKLEKVTEKITKPIHVTKLTQSEYIAHQYGKRVYKGREQITLFVTRKENEDMEPFTIHGYYLNEELQKIDLTRTIAPMSVRLGGNRNNKNSDRYTTIASNQIED